MKVFHKSLKQNAALGKPPVHCVTTQNNHVFVILYAAVKLECLKIKRHLNHFALRAHLYLKAVRVAFDELQIIKAVYYQLIIVEAVLCIRANSAWIEEKTPNGTYFSVSKYKTVWSTNSEKEVCSSHIFVLTPSSLSAR